MIEEKSLIEFYFKNRESFLAPKVNWKILKEFLSKSNDIVHEFGAAKMRIQNIMWLDPSTIAKGLSNVSKQTISLCKELFKYSATINIDVGFFFIYNNI